jgi:O-antigen/teichoic acid export membrane protein
MALEYGLALFQGQQRFRSFNALRFMPVLLYACALGVWAASSRADLVSVVAISVGATFVSGFGTLGLALWKLPASKPSASISFATIARFGRRGYLGYLSPLDSFRLDQLYVGLLLSPVALGIYAVAAAFTNLPRFVAQSIGMVAYPRVAASQDFEAARRRLWQFFWISAAISLLTLGALEVALGQLVPLLFGESYGGSVRVARVLLVATVLFSLRKILTDGSRGAGYPALGGIAEAVGLVSLAATIFVFGPRWGMMGVASAMAIAGATSFATIVGLLLSAPRRVRDDPRLAYAPVIEA